MMLCTRVVILSLALAASVPPLAAQDAMEARFKPPERILSWGEFVALAETDTLKDVKDTAPFDLLWNNCPYHFRNIAAALARPGVPHKRRAALSFWLGIYAHRDVLPTALLMLGDESIKIVRNGAYAVWAVAHFYPQAVTPESVEKVRYSLVYGAYSSASTRYLVPLLGRLGKTRADLDALMIARDRDRKTWDQTNSDPLSELYREGVERRFADAIQAVQQRIKTAEYRLPPTPHKR